VPDLTKRWPVAPASGVAGSPYWGGGPELSYASYVAKHGYKLKDLGTDQFGLVRSAPDKQGPPLVRGLGGAVLGTMLSYGLGGTTLGFWSKFAITTAAGAVGRGVVGEGFGVGFSVGAAFGSIAAGAVDLDKRLGDPLFSVDLGGYAVGSVVGAPSSFVVKGPSVWDVLKFLQNPFF